MDISIAKVKKNSQRALNSESQKLVYMICKKNNLPHVIFNLAPISDDDEEEEE